MLSEGTHQTKMWWYHCNRQPSDSKYSRDKKWQATLFCPGCLTWLWSQATRDFSKIYWFASSYTCLPHFFISFIMEKDHTCLLVFNSIGKVPTDIAKFFMVSRILQVTLVNPFRVCLLLGLLTLKLTRLAEHIFGDQNPLQSSENFSWRNFINNWYYLLVWN